jgi:hypothetical protein
VRDVAIRDGPSELDLDRDAGAVLALDDEIDLVAAVLGAQVPDARTGGGGVDERGLRDERLEQRAEPGASGSAGDARALPAQQRGAAVAKRWACPAPGDTFKTMTRTQTAPTDSLKVGDHVVSNVRGFDWKGVIIEDLGPLGVDGSQIFLVRVGSEDEGRQFDVPAENLERVAA